MQNSATAYQLQYIDVLTSCKLSSSVINKLLYLASKVLIGYFVNFFNQNPIIASAQDMLALITHITKLIGSYIYSLCELHKKSVKMPKIVPNC